MNSATPCAILRIPFQMVVTMLAAWVGWVTMKKRRNMTTSHPITVLRVTLAPLLFAHRYVLHTARDGDGPGAAPSF
jgi:hypothetical protein